MAEKEKKSFEAMDRAFHPGSTDFLLIFLSYASAWSHIQQQNDEFVISFSPNKSNLALPLSRALAGTQGLI